MVRKPLANIWVGKADFVTVWLYMHSAGVDGKYLNGSPTRDPQNTGSSRRSGDAYLLPTKADSRSCGCRPHYKSELPEDGHDASGVAPLEYHG